MNLQTTIDDRSKIGVRWTMTVFVLLASFVGSSLTTAGAHGDDREVAAAKEKLQALVKRAEDLQAEGKKKEAAELLRRAGALKERLAGYRASNDGSKREKTKRSERDDLLAALKGLEQGMKILEKLKRHEELDLLRRVALDVRRELGEKERPKRERTEREVALEQLEILRMALPAIREAGRKDTAQILEAAIRAREVALEGRKDEEAQAIRKRMPPLAHQVEILAYAAKLWREFGHPEKAKAVGGLAEKLRARYRKEKERPAAKGERRGKAERKDFEPREDGERRRVERREVRRDRDEPAGKPGEIEGIRREVGQLREEVQELRQLIRRLLADRKE